MNTQIPAPNDGNKAKSWKTVALVCAVLLLLLYTGCLYYLHFMQVLEPDRFLSDLKSHIEQFRDGIGYSLCVWVYGALIRTFGTTSIAIPFTLAQAATVLLAAWMIGTMLPELSLPVRIVLGVACCMETAVTLPGEYMYIGATTGTVYHNITYSTMQLAVIPACVWAFRVLEQMRTRVRLRDYAVYTLLLTVATSVKPNFLFGFAPALLVVLIMDFIRTRAKNWKNEFIVGCSVFPGLVICLLQATVLFGGESGGSIIWAPLAVWSYYGYDTIPWNALRSMLFIVLCALFALRKDKRFDFAFLFLMVATAEGALLAESGARMYHGNLFWTRMSAIMIAYIMGTALMCREWLRRPKGAHRPAAVAARAVVWGAWLLQWGMGLIFLISQMMGKKYFFRL